MTQELVKVTIDGMVVEVPKGTTIIEAAKQAGILVPHYCYHPSLPSPAVRRMCLVEVEKAPKLAPACVTTVAEGQVVHVNSANARKAREGVLEFLLINHPLDCPICDQAGECELQDYVFQEGQAGTRYSEYSKRYNPVEEFGPDVLYVPNRCILCTRCVRFMDDVAKDPVLNVSERGDRAFIGIDPDHELNHMWSGNVVDLCPVGSLISKDFLHKARAWDLDKTASVCPGCSQGCNMMIDTRDNTVVRLRPRPNLEVNRHFMCGYGRSDWWMNRGDRIEAPLVLDGIKHQAVDWDTALNRVAQLVGSASGGTVLLASGSTSTEDLGLVKQMLGSSVTAAVLVPMVNEEYPLPGIPNLALRKDRAANGNGARLLEYSTDNFSAALEKAVKAPLVVLLNLELPEAEAARSASHANLVVIGTVATALERNAQVVLPMTNMAEGNGTFVNRDLRVQRFSQAKLPRGMARPAWWIAAEVMELVQPGYQAPGSASDAFDLLSDAIGGLGGVRFKELGLTGTVSSSAAAEVAR